MQGASLRAGSFRSRFWNPATTAASLSGFRIHDLRHTAVSLWIAHGAPAKQVQVWAGHRSVATVFDRYGHLLPGNEEPVMNSLNGAAAGRPRLRVLTGGRKDVGNTRDGAAEEAADEALENGETPATAGASGSGRWGTRTLDLCRVKAAL